MTKLNTTTTVNGKTYDSKTGLPVAISETPHAARQTSRHPATSLHASAPQKSKTLRRVPPPKTTPKKETLSPMVTRRPQRRSLDIARHPQVERVRLQLKKSRKILISHHGYIHMSKRLINVLRQRKRPIIQHPIKPLHQKRSRTPK